LDHESNSSMEGCATCDNSSCLTCNLPYKTLSDSFKKSDHSGYVDGRICTTNCSGLNHTLGKANGWDEAHYWDNTTECSLIGEEYCIE